jgi:hypothetical protein
MGSNTVNHEVDVIAGVGWVKSCHNDAVRLDFTKARRTIAEADADRRTSFGAVLRKVW